jgi:hypothetical protein
MAEILRLDWVDLDWNERWRNRTIIPPTPLVLAQPLNGEGSEIQVTQLPKFSPKGRD